MRAPRTQRNSPAQPKKMLIRTTFFELIGSFIDAAKNDAEILMSVTQLLDRSDVRLVRSPAPVRLVAAADRKRSLAKTETSWA